MEGTLPDASETDRLPMLPRESNVTGLSVDLPHDFAFGHLHLCGDGDLLSAHHARRTPARELARTKTSQNGELERVKFNWTLYHPEPSFRDPTRTRTQRMTNASKIAAPAAKTSGARAGEDSIDMQPSQHGFGEGWAGMA